MIRYSIEPPESDPAIEALLDRSFGPARHLKTAQRLRDGRLPAEGLSFVASEGDAILGTLRFWHLSAGDGTDALLLGPVAVEPALVGQGIGRELIRIGLAEAARQNYPAVLLVGDPGYYGRFGFAPHRTRSLTLPGPFERHRLLGLELAPNALTGARGLIRPTGVIDPVWPKKRRKAA
jgi:predicted N-acetyltransferase YhbS